MRARETVVPSRNQAISPLQQFINEKLPKAFGKGLIFGYGLGALGGLAFFYYALGMVATLLFIPHLILPAVLGIIGLGLFSGVMEFRRTKKEQAISGNLNLIQRWMGLAISFGRGMLFAILGSLILLGIAH